MDNAFEILGVSETADDQSIKQAYFAKVKQYPPEQAPEKFKQIKEAYELIKSAPNRAAYRLFYKPDANFDELLERAFEAEEPLQAFDGRVWAALIRSSVKKK